MLGKNRECVLKYIYINILRSQSCISGVKETFLCSKMNLVVDISNSVILFLNFYQNRKGTKHCTAFSPVVIRSSLPHLVACY